MKNAKITQNWMSVIGFEGKEEYGYKVNKGKNKVFTDYVELRLYPEPEHPLYQLLEYTEKDWKAEHPNFEKFIEKDGKWNGDYLSKGAGYTMFEMIDRIITYVHFTHKPHVFNKAFFECSSVDNRDSVDVSNLLSEDEMNELIGFAQNCLKTDITKANKDSQWMYSEEWKERIIKENTKCAW